MRFNSDRGHYVGFAVADMSHGFPPRRAVVAFECGRVRPDAAQIMPEGQRLAG
jgi:hypothetical protein